MALAKILNIYVPPANEDLGRALLTGLLRGVNWVYKRVDDTVPKQARHHKSMKTS